MDRLELDLLLYELIDDYANENGYKANMYDLGAIYDHFEEILNKQISEWYNDNEEEEED